MKLSIERIGPIEKASIELVGLTVIAGENDTGKSSLGKVLFALVQAFTTFPLAIARNKNTQVRRDLDYIYFEIRRIIDTARYPEIRSFFSVLRTHSENIEDIPFFEIERFLHSIEQSHDYAENPRLIDSRISVIRKRINSLQLTISQDRNNQEAIGSFLHKALVSEFAAQIQLASSELPARITLTDGATTVLDTELNNSEVIRFSGGDPIAFRDATLIDGPGILQFFPAISNYDGLGITDRSSYHSSIPYHVVDLANKLRGARQNSKLNSVREKRICDVFAGELFFDDKNDNFYLIKNGIRIPSVNIASGIKALSIVDMLNRSDFINEDTLLILDEPETNLHPTWQIAYAKSICELARVGVKILVTTHSPYMLEALRGYSTNDEGAKFYLAQRNSQSNTVSYVDTFGDISPIIETLSRPLADFLDEINGDKF